MGGLESKNSCVSSGGGEEEGVGVEQGERLKESLYSLESLSRQTVQSTVVHVSQRSIRRDGSMRMTQIVAVRCWIRQL